MKKNFVTIFFLFVSINILNAQTNSWNIVGGKITSPWADSVNPSNVLPDYPRPQLQRSDWQNLNGLWQYAILPKAEGEAMPSAFQGNILVPFCVESALSGVGKTVGKDSVLWYERAFSIPSKIKGKKILLHFGAVDWRSDVYVNGNKLTTHEGGFDPFTVDITSALKKGTQQQIAVHVWDPTDEGPQPRGKQVINPKGIWYTPVTGIWQTVWLEAVPETYIASTKQTPDFDKKTLIVNTSVQNLLNGDMITVSAWNGDKKIAEQTTADTTTTLTIDNPESWSPSQSFFIST